MELVETVSLWEGGAERNGARCSGWYEGRGGEAERKKRAESAVSIRVDGATERLVNGGGMPKISIRVPRPTPKAHDLPLVRLPSQDSGGAFGRARVGNTRPWLQSASLKRIIVASYYYLTDVRFLFFKKKFFPPK